jgi:hypothetical protein
MRLSQHSAVARVVAGLLLVFVLYGTTIEAAHRHGRVFKSDQTQATSVSAKENAKGSASSFKSCAECLICQLHQNFSTSLVNTRFKDSPPAIRIEISQPTTAGWETRSVTTPTGRGPPLAN